MSRIAITGAAGFLGGHLVRAAAARGDSVVSIVREARAAGDVAMSTVLADPTVLDGVDLLVHAAAVRHRYGASAAAYRASNVDLVGALFRAAAGRVGRFVLVSSVGVYGFPPPAALPIRETSPFAPVTLYSATKIEGERLVARIGAETGLGWTILRPTIIYGRGDTNGMLDKLARMIRSRRYLVVGKGDNLLHHTYIDDVVDGILTLGGSDRAKNDAFILAGPETTTLARLSELVARALGRRIPPVHVPLALANAVASVIDVAAYRGLAFTTREPPINHEKLDVMAKSIAFDATKARAAGFSPRVGYEEGIAKTVGP